MWLICIYEANNLEVLPWCLRNQMLASYFSKYFLPLLLSAVGYSCSQNVGSCEVIAKALKKSCGTQINTSFFAFG